MNNTQIALLPEHHASAPFSQKSNEWYTPSRYIEAARAVMGSIDLDPASCELANRTVKATRFYSAKDNGLAQEWYGNVWLNPPYSHPNGPRQGNITGGNLKGFTGYFIDKLVEEYVKGHVTQAVICVNADMTRTWFRPLWDGVICFASPQVQFIRPDGTQEHHFYSTAFAYFGPNKLQFIDTFSKFGTVAIRVSPPKHASMTPSLWEGM